MDVNAHIETVCDQIVKGFNPEKIILFGSYAYGTPNRDSDVDLLVLMNIEGRGVDMATDIRIALYDPPFPLDLLVRNPIELERDLEMGNPFFAEVFGKGKILHAS